MKIIFCGSQFYDSYFEFTLLNCPNSTPTLAFLEVIPIQLILGHLYVWQQSLFNKLYLNKYLYTFFIL